VHWFRVAGGFLASLLLLTAAARHASGTLESGALGQASNPDTRNGPCQPQASTATVPFDTCKYLSVGPGIRPPRGASIVDPKYTDAARKAKINGSVIVAVAISEEGGVGDVKIVRPLGYGLDQNAMDAARQSKFMPATKDGKPIAVQLNMEMTFKLY
jgi:TonB family protein